MQTVSVRQVASAVSAPAQRRAERTIARARGASKAKSSDSIWRATPTALDPTRAWARAALCRHAPPPPHARGRARRTGGTPVLAWAGYG